MNHPVVLLFLGILGFIAGRRAERARPSGVTALLLPVVPGVTFWLPMGHPWQSLFVVLMVSICCFTAPLALLYGFHARRNAPQRVLAWAGLVLSLIAFLPFVMLMIASVLNLGDALCHWDSEDWV
jgi:uncharacterized membrane protein